MNNVVATFELERLSSALESEWWNKDEFVIFSGDVPPPLLKGPFRQDYYSFFIPDAGSMQLEVDALKYEAHRNDLVFINPSRIVQVNSISPETHARVVAFKKEFLDGGLFNPTEKLSFINSAPLLSLSEQEGAMIRDLIEDMRMKLSDNTRPNRRQVAINLIGVLLHEIDAIFRLSHGAVEKKPSGKEALNNQFHNLVATFFLKERSVKFYASMLNVTPRHLNEITKEITGKSAGDQIDEMIIREAKILLQNTTMPVKQIAEALHFSDQFSFSKYFKKFTKMSPTDYRDLL